MDFEEKVTNVEHLFDGKVIDPSWGCWCDRDHTTR